MEEWKVIEGFEDYEVSTEGRVWSSKSNKVLKTWVSNCNYELIGLSYNGKTKHKTVHRIVAEAFIPNPYGKKQVNHKDGNKVNNKVTNLEWNTQSENMKHANTKGLTRDRKGDNSFYHKVTSKDVLKIREMYASGSYLMREIGEEFNLSRHAIGDIISGKTWKHIK